MDTSSGYLEITATNATWCQYSNCTRGFFDVNGSSTYKYNADAFNATYTWDAVLTGDFGNDDVVIDGIAIPALELAVNYGSLPSNILGLGYMHGKSSDAPAIILQALLDSGHIKSAAYSLWVDRSTNAGTEGTILFGGVNTAKYTGDLHTMSLPAFNDIHYLPVVLVTKVSLQNGTSKSHSSSLPAYLALDSTISQTFLPNNIVSGLYQDLMFGGMVSSKWEESTAP